MTPDDGASDLIRINPARRERRFYRMVVVCDLFGQVWLLREHGRIGSPGRVIAEACASGGEACERLNRMRRIKLRRGYCPVSEATGAGQPGGDAGDEGQQQQHGNIRGQEGRHFADQGAGAQADG